MILLFQIRPLGEVIAAASEWMLAHFGLLLRRGVLPITILLALLSLTDSVWLLKIGIGLTIYWLLMLMAALIHYEQKIWEPEEVDADVPLPQPTWSELYNHLPWRNGLFCGIALGVITLLSMAGWGWWLLLFPLLYIVPYFLFSNLMVESGSRSPVADIFRVLPSIFPSLMAIGVFVFLVVLGAASSLGFYFVMIDEVFSLLFQTKQLHSLYQYLIAPIAITFWSVVLAVLLSWMVMGAAAVCFFLYGHGVEQLDYPTLRRKWTTF